ncbi:DUF397 domain-containing protein [Streptomyces mayteni]
MSACAWEKSSYSNEGANCVNLGTSPEGIICLRESDDPAVVLVSTPAAVRGLFGAIWGGCLPGSSSSGRMG